MISMQCRKGITVEDNKKKMNIANFTDIYTNIYTYIIPSRPNPGRREKIKLSFYFHISLW